MNLNNDNTMTFRCRNRDIDVENGLQPQRLFKTNKCEMEENIMPNKI